MTSALATDLYQLTMAAAYESAGLTGRSTFELFVRTLPPRRGFLVAAGIEHALEFLQSLRFTGEEIAWLRTVPALSPAPSSFFDAFLPAFRFRGDVWAVREGEPVFAGEPIVRVTARASEAQLVETALLALITFPTSVASKAARIVHAARGKPVVEFGSRRAPGPEPALRAARAAYLGGCAGTSNVEAGHRFGIPISGTMAHSWVTSFEHEVDAFRSYMELFGPSTTLLIDTYDTIRAAHAVVSSGLSPAFVRLDSGDLLELSRSVRRILDDGGLTATRILASGDLDEDRIDALLAAGAPIDAFGVGTSLSTSSDAPALGGVYKLVEIEREGVMVPVRKLSPGKQTLGSAKQVWRVAQEGRAVRDWIGLDGETPPEPGRPLLHHVMANGRRTGATPPLADTRATCLRGIGELPEAVRRLSEWEDYDVRFTDAIVGSGRSGRSGKVEGSRVW